MARPKHVPAPTPLPGQKVLSFTDSSGRQLEAGDFIRVTRVPRSKRFKIRHLFINEGSGKESIETYGPYNDRNERHPTACYRSFGKDEVAAKCRS